jgi:hypothetical protein
MIQPHEIRQKAGNLYSGFLRAWLRGENFFPKTIPCSKVPAGDLVLVAASVRRLREESKVVRGHGYSVQWTEVRSRTHGKNLFPTRIVLETDTDFLRYIGKEREFLRFAEAAARIRSAYPKLESWIHSHISVLIQSADEVDDLLRVVDYLRKHERPNVFMREIPVGDTKFVERNVRVLREWLDLVLPPHLICADEDHFERRFGLRYPEPQIMLRFLDAVTQRACGCPWPQFSLPLHTLAELPIEVEQVIIVENKINLLTLPPLEGTLALGGLGNGVTDLRYLPWLSLRPVWYWGDIDCEGLMILSRLRSVVPRANSFLMDDETFSQWRPRLATTGSGRRLD